MTKDLFSLQASADKAVEMHQRVASFVKIGMMLPQVDQFVQKNLIDLKCKSVFHLYQRGRLKFPSYACYSVNDCIVHGTAAYRDKPLAFGDLFKLDIGLSFQGAIADVGWTYAMGEETEQTANLMKCGKESLRKGIEKIAVDQLISEFSRAVQKCVEGYGFHVIKGLGGHGIGVNLHEPPYIPNCMSDFSNPTSKFQKNGHIAVEPMLSVGTNRLANKKNEWPIFTADGSLSVHFEHNLFVGEKETVLLSKSLWDLPEIIG